MDDLLLHGVKDIYYAENQSHTTPKTNLNEEKADKELSTSRYAKGVNRRAAR